MPPRVVDACLEPGHNIAPSLFTVLLAVLRCVALILLLRRPCVLQSQQATPRFVGAWLQVLR